MGLFDFTEKKQASDGSVKVSFDCVPATLEEFKALPEAQMKQPFDTAALTVLALSVYPKDKDTALAMLDYLKGPRPLSVFEKQFIRDRFMDYDYVPRSYFEGATPANDYEPALPLTVTVSENPYSYKEENFATLYISSGGADSPRSVQLRLAKDGKWYLWEQFLLSGIREPESRNPWA